MINDYEDTCSVTTALCLQRKYSLTQAFECLRKAISTGFEYKCSSPVVPNTGDWEDLVPFYCEQDLLEQTTLAELLSELGLPGGLRCPGKRKIYTKQVSSVKFVICVLAPVLRDGSFVEISAEQSGAHDDPKPLTWRWKVLKGRVYRIIPEVVLSWDSPCVNREVLSHYETDPTVFYDFDFSDHEKFPALAKAVSKAFPMLEMDENFTDHWGFHATYRKHTVPHTKKYSTREALIALGEKLRGFLQKSLGITVKMNVWINLYLCGGISDNAFEVKEFEEVEE